MGMIVFGTVVTLITPRCIYLFTLITSLTSDTDSRLLILKFYQKNLSVTVYGDYMFSSMATENNKIAVITQSCTVHILYYILDSGVKVRHDKTESIYLLNYFLTFSCNQFTCQVLRTYTLCKLFKQTNLSLFSDQNQICTINGSQYTVNLLPSKTNFTN